MRARPLSLAPTVDFRSSDIPRREVGPRAFPLVLVLHSHRTTGGSGQRGVNPLSSLDAGLLVRRDDAVGCGQRPALPASRIEIKNAVRLLLKRGVPRKDPRPVGPWPDGVLSQPAPQGRLADGRHKATPDHLPLDIRDTEARQRKAALVGELTRQCLNRHYDAGGKSGLGARCVKPLPSRQGRPRRIAFATW